MVVVDAPEFNDPTISQKIQMTVENTRAAGIYATIKPTDKITLKGVVQVVASQANPTTEEQLALEEKVFFAIEGLLQELKMGQPLLRSKLTKAILAVEGVEDFSETKVQANKVNPASVVDFDLSKQQVEAKDTERFILAENGEFAVASAPKTLIVNISFKKAGLTEGNINTLKTNLQKELDKVIASNTPAADKFKIKIQALKTV